MENIIARYAVLWMIGLGSGFFVAGGVIALVIGLGIVTRYAGITHTAVHCKLYETCILFGGMFGTLLTVYGFTPFLGRFMLMILGLSAGIYVGSWILALAEVVKMFPIFARRIGITRGTGFLIVSIAMGKVLGSTIQFFMNW